MIPESFSSSIEETFKRAYSHGLERIYALETVDLSKVTRIESPLNESSISAVEPAFSLWNGQYQLELGDEYRGWMPPLFLQEPIQVLKLPQRIEKELIERGYRRLSDLMKKQVFEKMSQRDAYEIESKCLGYGVSRSQERTFFIEWASLIRSLMVGSDLKKGAALLETFQLEGLIPLNSLEKMEFLSLRPERKEQWKQEIREFLIQPEKQKQAYSLFFQIAKVFVTPWMWTRGGIASLEQIEERLEKVSEEPLIAKQAMVFLSALYCEKRFLFREAFLEIEEGLFAADRFFKEAFKEVCEKAEKYFYKSNVAYSLEELLSFLRRDFAREWKEYPEEWMRLFLRRSFRFQIYKNKGSTVEIRLK